MKAMRDTKRLENMDENLETQKIYAEDESDERYEKIGKLEIMERRKI